MRENGVKRVVIFLFLVSFYYLVDTYLFKQNTSLFLWSVISAFMVNDWFKDEQN